MAMGSDGLSPSERVWVFYGQDCVRRAAQSQKQQGKRTV
jgi:hypothetical protein